MDKVEILHCVQNDKKITFVIPSNARNLNLFSF